MERNQIRQEKKKNRMRWLLYVGACVVLLIFLHAQGFSDSFLSDDFDWVTTAQTHVDSGKWFESFAQGNGGNFYRPLVAFSFQIDYAISRLNPIGYHLHQLLFHILLVIGLGILIYLVTKQYWISFLVSGLFAVLPNQHEVVTWLGGRPDLYAAIFSIWSVALFLFFVQKRNWYAYAGALFLDAGALLSKETAFVLPLLVVGIVVAYPFDSKKVRWKYLGFTLPWFALLVGVLFARSTVLTDAIGGYVSAGERSGLDFSSGDPKHIFLSFFNIMNWSYFQELLQNSTLYRIFLRVWEFFTDFWYIGASLTAFFLMWLTTRLQKSTRPWILYALGWIILGFIPVYALTDEISLTRLTASRLFFFASVGYALLLSTYLMNMKSIHAKRTAKISIVAIGILLACIWMINAVPWHTGAKHVATVQTALKNESTKARFSEAENIIFQNLPDIVHGAYAFFGPHAIRGIVNEISSEKTIFNANERPYTDSPFCSCDLSRTIVYSWNAQLESLEQNKTALPDPAQPNTCTLEELMWDMSQPEDVNKWTIHGFESQQTDNGLQLKIPEQSNGYIALSNLSISGFTPQTLKIEFDVLDSGTQTDWQTIVAWKNDEGFSVRRQLGIRFPSTQTSVSIPLCKYINWSTSGTIQELRIRPITGATILLKSISLQ